MTIREKVARTLAAYARMESFEKPTPAEIAAYVEDEWPLFVEEADAALAALPVTVEDLEKIARGEAFVWSGGVTTQDERGG